MTEQDGLTFTPSRRGIMRFAALTGVIGGLGTLTVAGAQATDNNSSSVFPSDFSYPAIVGPSLALWGSSTIEGARATEGVATGVDTRLHVLLQQYLGVPVLPFGTGSETSTNILARRGVEDYVTKIDFPNDLIPASGATTVTLTNTNIVWNSATYFPGYVQEIPGVLRANENSANTYTFTRMDEGAERYAPGATTANRFYSLQEKISLSSYHLIQIGRNNISETDKLKLHTQAAFDMAPERTIVMGHFVVNGDTQDSARSKAVTAYNSWASQTYGNLFMNPQDYLRETTKETWLRYGDLSGSGVWNSNDDTSDYNAGRPPRSLYASDGIHLNGWGYLALARMIQAKINEMGWFA